MDDETREYLEGMEARIASSFNEKLGKMEARLKHHHKERIDDLYKSIVQLLETHGVSP